MLRALLALCFLFSTALLAGLQEQSPSANALAGISLLSDSVAESYLSPAHTISGISCFYHRPYNMGELPVYGIATAVKRDWLSVSAGAVYLNHPDYLWQNPYLNIAVDSGKLCLGAGLNLDYSLVGESDSHYLFSGSYAAKYRYRDSHLELKALHLNAPEQELCLSIAQNLSGRNMLGFGVARDSAGKNSLKAGMSIALCENLQLYSSWQNEPARFGAGLNILMGKWHILCCLRNHPRLAASQAFALEYAW